VSTQADLNDGCDRTRFAKTVIFLLLLALSFEAGLLFLNRASLPDSISSPWVRDATMRFFAPLEESVGKIPQDFIGTRENFKVAELMASMAGLSVLFLIAIAVVEFMAPRSDSRILGIILVTSLIFRLTLAPYPPLIETDIHRYLFDGAVMAHGISPYKYSPSEIRDSYKRAYRHQLPPDEQDELKVIRYLIQTDPSIRKHYARVNHPSIRTIYPPLTQLLFAISARVSSGSQEVWKLLNILIDFLILIVIVGFLRVTNLNLNRVLIYGWCPFVLKEYANTGHHDPVATLMALLSLWYIWRGHRILAGLLVGLGILSKIYPAIFLILFRRRLGVRGWVAAGILVVMGYAPFVVSGGFQRSFDGLTTFGKRWEFNSSVFAVTEKIVWRIIYGQSPGEQQGPDRIQDERIQKEVLDPVLAGSTPEQFIRRVTRVALAAVLLIIMLVRSSHRHDTFPDILRSAFLGTGASFLLAPVSDPWYLGWVMPYVALFPTMSWLYLSCSIHLYYVYFWIPRVGLDWGYKDGVRLIEYVPFYLMLLRELTIARRQSVSKTPTAQEN